MSALVRCVCGAEDTDLSAMRMHQQSCGAFLHATAAAVPGTGGKRTATKRRYAVKEVNGTLKCNCSASGGLGGWCEHQQGYIASQSDAEALHDMDLLQVPVVPSKDLWIQVRLGDPTDIGKFRPVSVTTVTREPGKQNPVSTQLGFLSPTEGRLVIRNLILDWLRGQTAPVCNSKTHVPRKVTRESEVVEIWNLLSSGKCAYCNGFTNYDADVPEL